MATSFNGYLEAAFTVPSSVTLSATTNAGGPTTVTVTAGTYTTITDFLVTLTNNLNAQRSVSGGTWSATWSHGVGATGLCTIAVSNGTFSITWVDPTLQSLLGFLNNISGVASSTGTYHVRGAWHPDCPLNSESGHIYNAPKVTDLRQTESPTGFVIGHVGNVKYRHRGLSWSHCPANKVWIGQENPLYESLESFLNDTQWGQGLSWFAVSSKTQITTQDGSYLGINQGSLTSWYLKGVGSMDAVATRAVPGFDGLWAVKFAEAVSDG